MSKIINAFKKLICNAVDQTDYLYSTSDAKATQKQSQPIHLSPSTFKFLSSLLDALSLLKASKPLLTTSTLLVRTSGTSQHELLRSRVRVGEMGSGDIGDGFDEVRRSVQGFTTLDTGESHLMQNNTAEA